MLNALIYFSGGIENPFKFYFIFHMVIASILLSTKASYFQATLAAGLFNGMILLEYFRIIPHVSLFPEINESQLYADPAYLIGNSAVFTSTLFLTVYMATSIVNKLREHEKEMLELKEDLEETNFELTELHKYRSRFILKVEHELKAPLGAIGSLLNVVLSSFSDSLQPKVRELLERAVKRTNMMLDMIRELIDLSRIQSTGYSIEKKPENLKELVMRQVELIRPQAESKGLDLRFVSKDELPEVSLDFNAISNVVMNLLSNAVKYTLEGSVSITLEKDGVFALITVEDTGIGMNEEDSARVFEEFFRASSAKADFEGTGLGLSIVMEVVDNHGGMIEHSSKLGEGSQFKIRLPLQ